MIKKALFPLLLAVLLCEAVSLAAWMQRRPNRRDAYLSLKAEARDRTRNAQVALDQRIKELGPRAYIGEYYPTDPTAKELWRAVLEMRREEEIISQAILLLELDARWLPWQIVSRWNHDYLADSRAIGLDHYALRQHGQGEGVRYSCDCDEGWWDPSEAFASHGRHLLAQLPAYVNITE